MKKLFKSNVLVVSIIFISLGFNVIKKDNVVKENKEVIELIDNMDASFNVLPFELSLEEKLEVIQNPELLIEITEKYLRSENEEIGLACYSLCWRRYSNCWKGLSYYVQGSDEWIDQVDKCFIDLFKCSRKCEKEEGSSPGVVQ